LYDTSNRSNNLVNRSTLGGVDRVGAPAFT
jgi:hypothetical protein